MKKNILPIAGLGMLAFTALALATTAAYQSIIGLADLFAARMEVVIVMAIFIEWAKLLFAGALHMFWREIPWWKWLGVFIVVIHMAVTNIGIYSYLSSGYLLQEAPVAAIERQISDVDRRIDEQEKVEEEASRQISAMDTAYQRYVEELYIRRAEKYKTDNAESRAQLEAQRDEARQAIDKLEEEKRGLIEAKVDGAAKLGSIEHISAFAGEDQESVMKVVVFFTLLLMLGLDPAAILMVVLFTHLLSKVVGRKESEVVSSTLDADEEKAAKHLKDIGFLEHQKKRFKTK